MTLSIIIVSYNVKYFLEQCLCSVKEAVQNIEAEIIVIDNGSSDDSLAYLQPKFPQVRFIKNEANDGFAKANNKALLLASGNYILFLNPDTILAEDTLEQCVFFFEKNAKAGAIGVRMIDGSGHFLPESKRAFPSPSVSFYKLTGLSSLFPKSRIFNRYALGYLSQKGVHEVDVLAGAFLMVKKNILDEISSFDERFFMYAEDIDLSYRIQKAGYQNYYLGDVTIVHFKGESTKKGSLNYVRIFYSAMTLFVKKHYKGAGAFLLRQLLQTGIAVRGFLSALILPFQKEKQVAATLFDGIILLGDDEATSRAQSILIKHYPHLPYLKNQDFSSNKLVVFCNGNLSYQKSIDLLEQNKKAAYKWFGKNSTSIVGSNSKNTSGDALV